MLKFDSSLAGLRPRGLGRGAEDLSPAEKGSTAGAIWLGTQYERSWRPAAVSRKRDASPLAGAFRLGAPQRMLYPTYIYIYIYIPCT